MLNKKLRKCFKCGKPIDMNKDEYVVEKCMDGMIWHKNCDKNCDKIKNRG